MIQCIICEDWYHGTCLKIEKSMLEKEDNGELICIECISKHEHLQYYNILNPESETGKRLFVNNLACTLYNLSFRKMFAPKNKSRCWELWNVCKGVISSGSLFLRFVQIDYERSQYIISHFSR